MERDKDGVSSGGGGEREGEKDAGCWPCRWRTAPPAKECGRPLETGKGEETASPLEPPKETQLCRRLGFRTSDFQNHKIINPCGLEPLSLLFVPAATGNHYGKSARGLKEEAPTAHLGDHD